MCFNETAGGGDFISMNRQWRIIPNRQLTAVQRPQEHSPVWDGPGWGAQPLSGTLALGASLGWTLPFQPSPASLQPLRKICKGSLFLPKLDSCCKDDPEKLKGSHISVNLSASGRFSAQEPLAPRWVLGCSPHSCETVPVRRHRVAMSGGLEFQLSQSQLSSTSHEQCEPGRLILGLTGGLNFPSREREMVKDWGAHVSLRYSQPWPHTAQPWQGAGPQCLWSIMAVAFSFPGWMGRRRAGYFLVTVGLWREGVLVTLWAGGFSRALGVINAVVTGANLLEWPTVTHFWVLGAVVSLPSGTLEAGPGQCGLGILN